MVNVETFRQLALSFEGVTEQPHFKKCSFRVNKKIFATLNIDSQRAVLKLSEIDQSVFCSFGKSVIYPVSGSWGKLGWTTIELKNIKKVMLKDVMKSSYYYTAQKTFL